MAVEFDIIKYLSSLLGGYTFDVAVLERIAMERDLTNVTSVDEISNEKKSLALADLAFVAYNSPNVIAGVSESHGNFSRSIGSTTINEASRERLYNIFSAIYKKYDEEKLEFFDEGGTVTFMDCL